MPRIRLLDRLCRLYPELEREHLLARVLCGEVRVGAECVRDPRSYVEHDAAVSIVTRRYVGRGGIKLEHAIAFWNLPVEDAVMLDAGSSTGGFTDCLLQHGARLVHAVDVGWNQLDYRLRTDERVQVHERTNIMEIRALEPAPESAVADLSFRSLRGAATRVFSLSGSNWAVLLLKPQFEWLQPPDDFNGTVPSERLPEILTETLEALDREGLPLVDMCESPIRGAKGNREFLLYIGQPGAGPSGEAGARESRTSVSQLVTKAIVTN